MYARCDLSDMLPMFTTMGSQVHMPSCCLIVVHPTQVVGLSPGPVAKTAPRLSDTRGPFG